MQASCIFFRLGLSLKYQPAQQVRHERRDSDGDEAGHHERVVQEVLAYLRSAGTVEVDSSHIGRVCRDEEIAVHRGQDTEHDRSGYAEAVGQR